MSVDFVLATLQNQNDYEHNKSVEPPSSHHYPHSVFSDKSNSIPAISSRISTQLASGSANNMRQEPITSTAPLADQSDVTLDIGSRQPIFSSSANNIPSPSSIEFQRHHHHSEQNGRGKTCLLKKVCIFFVTTFPLLTFSFLLKIKIL